MNLIKMLCSLGTQNIVDSETKNRIITVNAIAALTAVFAFILGYTFYYFTGNGRILYPAILEGLSFLCILPLNYYGFHRWTPIHAQLTHNFAMVYFGILLSQAVDATLLVAFLFGHAYFFFSRDDKEERQIRIVCMAIAGVSFFVMEAAKQFNLIEVLPFNKLQYLVVHFCGSAVIIVLIVLIISKYQKVTAKLTNEKIILLEKVKQQNEELELKIKERTSELQTANNSIMVYLREISHEIRTPLSSILYATQFLKEKIEENYDKLNNVIHSSCERALRIINNILTYEKISKGEYQNIHHQAFLFQPFITDIVNANQIIANEQSVRIQLETNTETFPYAIISDQTALEKILNNLLVNAIKFTKEQTEVLLHVEVKDNVMSILVSDQGQGIPEELLPYIFQPFPPAQYKFIEGNGIGLTLVERLVHLLEGKIQVKSGSMGTTFEIEIPVTTTEIESVRKASKTIHKESLVNTKILIIEDEPMARAMANKILSGAGCTTSSVGDFKEGMVQLAIDQPDIIVLDLGMPGTHGFDALQKLKRDPVTANIPVIIMSANGFEEDIKRTYELGVAGYLVKPIKEHLIIEAVLKCKKAISTNKILKSMI